MEQKTINLFRRILKTVAPPLDIKPSGWAEQNLVLNESALSNGKWRPDTAPWQPEIMDAVKDPTVEKIVIMSASQGGKNVIVNTIIGYYVDVDPCPIMLIEPSLELAEDYSKRRLAPLISDTRVLREKIHEAKSRDSNNTILLKLFPGGSLNLVGANSPRSLASKPIRVVIADEIDGFELSAGKEGDPLKLADRRSTTYWNRKKIYVSTPVLAGFSRIEQEFLKGTQERWNIECPNCGDYQYINMQGIKFKHEQDAKGNYKAWDITFQCPACLEKFDEYTWKQQPGKWVAYNPAAKKVRSFHWNAFIYPWGSWEDIVLEWLTVKKDPEQHKVFKNTVLGLPWEETLGQEEYQFLLDRREEYPAELPDGVLLLTAGVDTQDDRLEYEIVGWGRGEQTWGIEYGVIMGKPDKPETWQTLSDKLGQVFRFTSGIGLKVACALVDSGGHYTQDVYEWCHKNECRKIFACRGMSRPGLSIIHSTARSKKENCRYFNLGVDGGKTRILSRVQIKQPGDGYYHYPLGDRGYDQTYFQGLLSEYQDTEKQGGKLKLVWKKRSSNIRNEPLDVRNYAQAAFYLLSVNWDALEGRIKNSAVPKASTSVTGSVLPSGVKKGLVKKTNIW
jgi:phage terminase large subunit GpA-like protein